MLADNTARGCAVLHRICSPVMNLLHNVAASGNAMKSPEARAIGNTLRKPRAVEYRHGTRSAQLHHSGRGDAAGSDHVGVVVAVAAVADVRRQTIAGHTSVGSPRPGRSSEDIAGRQDRARVDQPAPAEQRPRSARESSGASESGPRRLVVQKAGAEGWSAPHRRMKTVGRENDHGTQA